MASVGMRKRADVNLSCNECDHFIRGEVEGQSISSLAPSRFLPRVYAATRAETPDRP